MDAWLSDLRFGIRFLGRHRGTTLIAVLALTLGIGATTAIFSVVYDVLLRPLPSRTANACGRLRSVSGAFFRALRVRPERGRSFAEGSAEPMALVSHRFWQRGLGGEADLSRLRLRLEGAVFEVIGVLPAGGQFPADTDVYVSKALVPRNPHRTGHNWRTLGRLRDGVSLEQARADLRAIAQRLRRQYGDDTLMADAEVVPVREALAGKARPGLLVLLGSVGFLLLAACANVANLLLAQAASRQRELAVRMALGAGRGHLLRQLLTEALLLSAVGGATGVLLAFWAVRALGALDTERLPRAQEVGMSLEALLCAVVLCVLTATGLGLLTAFKAARETALAALADGQRAPAGGTGPQAARRSRDLTGGRYHGPPRGRRPSWPKPGAAARREPGLPDRERRDAWTSPFPPRPT